jgi:hypothetical protein
MYQVMWDILLYIVQMTVKNFTCSQKRRGNSMEKNPEKARMLKSVNNYISRFVTDRDHGRKRVDQLLKENGMIVCPYQRGPMMVLRKTNGRVKTQFTQEQYAFVPLIV